MVLLANAFEPKAQFCVPVVFAPKATNPKFLNLCLKFESRLKASELHNEIKKIEKKLGRIRIKKNEPRTCDIDIIDFNGEII